MCVWGGVCEEESVKTMRINGWSVAYMWIYVHRIIYTCWALRLTL